MLPQHYTNIAKAPHVESSCLQNSGHWSYNRSPANRSPYSGLGRESLTTPDQVCLQTQTRFSCSRDNRADSMAYLRAYHTLSWVTSNQRYGSVFLGTLKYASHANSLFHISVDISVLLRTQCTANAAAVRRFYINPQLPRNIVRREC